MKLSTQCFILSATVVEMRENSKFDITCISLEREAKRRDHMIRMLDLAGCEFRIFNAVDGNLIISQKKDIKEYCNSLDLTLMVKRHLDLGSRYYGTVGLKLSNYILMRELEQSKSDKPLLILEDDADLEADFVTVIEDMLDKMNKEWDIILLTPRYWADHERPFDENTGLEGMGFFYGTYGMMINGSKSAKKLADFLEVCPPTLPIDDYYGELSKNKKIIGYAFKNQLVTHLGNIFQSTIGTSYPLNPANLKLSLYELSNLN